MSVLVARKLTEVQTRAAIIQGFGPVISGRGS